MLACYVLLLVAFIPGAFLTLHYLWRKVSIHKRSKFIFGFFISAWIMLLSIGVQDPNNAPDGYNVLVVGLAIAIAGSYWWLHRKRDKAEEVFP